MQQVCAVLINSHLTQFSVRLSFFNWIMQLSSPDVARLCQWNSFSGSNCLIIVAIAVIEKMTPMSRLTT